MHICNEVEIMNLHYSSFREILLAQNVKSMSHWKQVFRAWINYNPIIDWKNRFITHLIIIIKSEVSTFPIVVIFFRGCVSEMVVLSYSVIYYIYIPEALRPCFRYWYSVYGICKFYDTLWPVGRVRLFADYTISLSSLCRLIWRHWTTKMLVMYMLPSVCLRLRQFSQLSFIQYMGLCVSAYPILPWWSWECVLYLIIIIKPGVWIINHCLGLGHETMVCAVYLTMFLLTSNHIHYKMRDELLYPFPNINGVDYWFHPPLYWACDNLFTLELTHWGRDKMEAISQTTLSSAFFLMKILNSDSNLTGVCF